MDGLIAWAQTVEITVNRFNMTDEAIRQAAVENAHMQRYMHESRAANRGEYFGHETEYLPDEDRALVSFLRHLATNYDVVLKELSSSEFSTDIEPERDSEGLQEYLNARDEFTTSINNAYTTIRRRVHEKLAAVYPQFAYEISVESHLPHSL